MTRAGSRFGRYELRSLLGRGGMGEVYVAYDTSKDRVVALKLLPPEFARNTGYEQRFRREAHAAARLQEPHVIPIHDWGEHDGVLYIDMRLVEGQDLRRLLVAQGPMPPQRAVAIVGQVASALDAAHAHGLVHRDVKPENILIGARDFAYLVDFGIASDARDVALTPRAARSAPTPTWRRSGSRRAGHRAGRHLLAGLRAARGADRIQAISGEHRERARQGAPDRDSRPRAGWCPGCRPRSITSSPGPWRRTRKPGT